MDQQIKGDFLLHITKEEIKDYIKRISTQINKDYQNEEIVLVGVLNGSFIFLADLIREIKVNCVVDFIGLSSYNGETYNSDIVITKNINVDVCNKHVVVVEDIVDTGNTIKFLQSYFKELNVKSLKICSLINKKQNHNINVDYWGFNTNKFIIGYGFDYKYYYRNLPEIYCLKE